MKIYFLTFLFFIHISTSMSQDKKKERVLLVFPKLENMSVTGDMVVGGVELSKTFYPEFKDFIEFIRVDSDRNVKIMGETTLKAIEQHKPIAIIASHYFKFCICSRRLGTK
jgi:hypothetical protein